MGSGLSLYLLLKNHSPFSTLIQASNDPHSAYHIPWRRLCLGNRITLWLGANQIGGVIPLSHRCGVTVGMFADVEISALINVTLSINQSINLMRPIATNRHFKVSPFTGLQFCHPKKSSDVWWHLITLFCPHSSLLPHLRSLLHWSIHTQLRFK